MRFQVASKLVTLNLFVDVADAPPLSPPKNGEEIWDERLKPGISELLRLAESVSEKRKAFLIAYKRWHQCIDGVEIFLKDSQSKILKHLRNSNWVEALGSSVSAAGSAIGVTGLALALPTVGLSLGLTIGGMVTSVIGGAVAGGSSVVGGILRKRLKEKSEKEYDIFKTRSKKLQLRLNEYSESLNQFFQLYSNIILKCSIEVSKIENPSLIVKYFSGEGSNVIFSPIRVIRLLEELTTSKKKRQSEVTLLKRIAKLITDDPCLLENSVQFSTSDFGFNDDGGDKPETIPLPPAQKLLKCAKLGVGLLEAGSMTPTIFFRFVEMSSDVAEAFAKGAVIVGRSISITFGSLSLGLDVLLVANAFRKIYKGPVSKNLEEVNNLIKELEDKKSKVIEDLRGINMGKDQQWIDSNEKTS